MIIQIIPFLAKKIMSNKKFKYSIAVSLLFIFISVAYIGYQITKGSRAQRSAADLIGQRDINSALDYTLSNANNSLAINNVGFNTPGSVAIDTVNHRLFVADSSNNRVLIFNLDTSNNLSDRVADYVLGQANFTSNSSGRTDSAFNYPYGLAYDSTNNRLFVGDMSNHRVLVFNIVSITNGEAAANVLGQPDFTSQTSGVNSTSTGQVFGLAYDAAGNRLFTVSDANKRVMVFDVASISNGEAAANVLGQPNFTSNGATTTQSGLNTPFDAALYSTDNLLFVSDYSNNRVMVFDVASITNGEPAVNVLGQANFTSSTATTTQSGFNQPWPLAIDATNKKLYVGDQGNSRAMVFDITSVADGESAVSVLGQTNFTQSGSGLTQSKFNTLTGLEIDAAGGKLYAVVDQQNRVLIFDVTSITNGENATDLLGQLNTANEPLYTFGATNNVHINDIGFVAPENIAVDTVNHRMFISDTSNHRVLVFNLDTSNNLSDRVADYVLGQANFYANSSAITASGMNSPQGLAYNSASNTLFVADQTNHRVLVFNVSSITNGEDAINVFGQSDFVSNSAATTAAGLSSPWGLLFDSASTSLYVSDAGNHRVMIFNSNTTTNGGNAINVLGQASFTAGSAATTQAGLSSPRGMALKSISSGKTLFVSDNGNNRVIAYNVSVIANGEAAVNVLGQSIYSTATGATTQGGLNGPKGLAYQSPYDVLFVADSANNRVMIFDVNAINDGENAVEVIGQANYTASTAATTQTGLSGPSGLVFVNSINATLYIADAANNRIVAYRYFKRLADNAAGQTDGSGQASFIANTANNNNGGPSTNGLSSPTGVAIDTVNHRMFVGESGNHRVLVFNLDVNNNLTDYTADYVLGQANFSSNGSTTTQSGFNAPEAIEYDSASNTLYVADYGNNRIMIFDMASITNGENAVNVLGQANFTGSSGGTTSSTLSGPEAIAVDSTNRRLFVQDGGNNRVLVFDISAVTNGEGAANVLGQANFTTATAGTTATTLSLPWGIDYDSASNTLYVGDNGNNRVVIYDVAAISNGEAAVKVIGQANLTSGGAATTINGLSGPSAVMYNANNKTLYVGEYTNHRVMVYDLDAVVNGEDAINVIGQTDYVTGNSAVSQSGFNNLYGLDLNADRNILHAAEYSNNRVLIFKLIDITTTTLPAATQNASYSGQITVTGTQATVSYSLFSGSLPAGLSLNTSTGYITGTPTATGTFSFVIEARDTDPIGYYRDRQSFSVIVTPTLQFTQISSSGNENTAGSPFELTLSGAMGTDVTAIFSVTGGTATTSDYTLTTTTVTISSGATTTSLLLSINIDSDVEANETLEVTLSSATNAVLGVNTTHTFTITNDDAVAETPAASASTISGSLPVISAHAPESPDSTADNPQGGFKVEINKGDAYSNFTIVNLALFGGEDTVKMSISNHADFKNAIIVPYSQTTTWNLCETPICTEGVYTAYARFYTKWGAKSEAVSDSIFLVAKPILDIVTLHKSIIGLLKQKSHGNDVMALQTFLNEQGFFKHKITGYFGPITRQALIQWQKKHKLSATGAVDKKTRDLINKMLKQD